jgi:hypothetical protein
MMHKDILLALLLTPGLLGPTVSEKPDDFRRFERELTDVLRWEIMWSEANQPRIKLRLQGPATLAIYLTPKALFYCSHDLNKCTGYLVEPSRLVYPFKEASCDTDASPCKQGQTDSESLKAFVLQRDPILESNEGAGAMGYTPGWTVADKSTKVSTWTTRVNLGTKSEIVEYYRQLRPAELDSLKEWFADLGGAGYRSVTIPCFAFSDPEIYVYGDRAELGPIIIDVKWQPEGERWEEAGMIPFLWRAPTVQEQRAIEGYRKTIESIKCATVEFPK